MVSATNSPRITPQPARSARDVALETPSGSSGATPTTTTHLPLAPRRSPLPSRAEGTTRCEAPTGLIAARMSPAPKSPPKVVAPDRLRLTNSDGQRTEVPACSYYLDSTGQPRAGLEPLVEVALGRSPRAQQRRDEALKIDHARHEMSFRVKDPDTGHYDKIFQVPANGSVVPISETHFRMLVDSTGPVMRALRQMLQRLYAAPNADARALGLDDLPESAQAQIMEAIQSSIYFEPKLVCPEMKDYPFLAVAGFDAAVGELDAPQPVFFEYNLGTPSGLSNNVQLLESLRENDPELYATIAAQLPEDDTFGVLRRAIESNAAAWTGRDDGISVVVSPGVYNGAHPDVASIAMFSGMPLVNPSDLYTDASGDVRLDTGADADHPVVTGVYGRMEESFFIQDCQEGIPLRSPDFADNPQLGEKLGLELEPGVIYEFDYDSEGRPTGVHCDEHGQPKLQKVFETIGRDPSQPDRAPGSFAGAIKGRKLYYSGLGGRVVDDKRVFQAVSQHLAPKFAAQDAPIARPPRTLEISEYGQFYDSKSLERFVVKAPDRSGGDGVMLMVNLTDQRRREVVEEVKAHPEHFIVQEFAEPAVMLCPEAQGQQMVYGSLANDWRLFTMMDADGHVDAGSQSVLLRTAKPLSASTNTSQGGGYGVAVVLGEERDVDQEATLIPSAGQQDHVGASRKADLQQFLVKLNELTERTEPQYGPLPRDGQASLLAHFQRQAMDLLGRDLSPYMTELRRYDAGETSAAQLHTLLLELAVDLRSTQMSCPDVASQLRAGLRGYTPPPLRIAAPTAPEVDREAVRARLKVEAFDAPNLVRNAVDGDDAVQSFEVGRYVEAPHPFVESVMKELGALGGELRMVRRRVEGTDRYAPEPAGAYFRLEGDRPVIGIDLSQDRALSGLAHEREHLRLWNELKDDHVERGQSPQEAAEAAMRESNTPDLRVVGERRAVEAEMIMDRADRGPWNTSRWSAALTSTDPGYISRVTYPEVEGVRDLLHRARWSDETLDSAKAHLHLGRAIAAASKARTTRVDAHLERARDARTPVEAAQHRAAASAVEARSLFVEIFTPPTIDRFRADQTLEGLVALYEEAIAGAELDASQEAAPARATLQAGSAQQ